ncbi:IS481 family transposase, partial [Klebsiella pneumoniae]|nr:IS481 family transposase [Klebsiella pneumoniae]
MLMQHIGVGYFGYYRATAYAMKHSLMPEIAKLRMKALNFWDKHGIRAAADAFDVSTRTLYWWRRLLRTGGPEALIPRSKAPLVRRSRHWHPDVLKEIRRLRTELPNLGKEQIFVRLKPWCEARHFTCPSTSTIGRIIAGAHDKMRMIPVRLSARGKARLIKKRSVKPRRPKQYRPVKTGELIGMDAIELRMGDLRRYIITMIDEHSDYALALAVPSLNSDITSHFFSKATKLFPVAIRQVVTDNGKEFLGNFDKTLQEASIKHIWTYPYTPKMNATCERFNRTLREQFIEFNELLLFEDLNLFNQRMAEYLVLYNSKRPHKSLELMTPVDYILRESKNCNMWWTHTIAGAHDKMRMIPVRLSARGKARLIKKRSVKPRRPKQYRPVKTGELIGMDAIELRMGDLRRYIITMIDEHSDYALALAVPSLNSDITSHFFSKATKLFPVAIRQVVTDNGKEFLGNFDKTLQEASIKHIWTYPYTPKMNATCERFNRTLREQFIEFNELLLFEDLNLFNQRMAEYLVLYNSKRPHKSLELMTPVDYILRESKNCNMWWTHT